MTRIFLFIVGLIFTGYGLACAVDPTLAARNGGLAIMNGDGYAELGAMYGGLQVGVGMYCLLGALRPHLKSPALLLLVMAVGLLAVARGASALRSDEILTTYTWSALAFESLVTAMAAGLLLRSR